MSNIDITLTVAEDLAYRFRNGQIKGWDSLTPGEQDDIYAQMFSEAVSAVGPPAVSKGMLVIGVVRSAQMFILDVPMTVMDAGEGWIVTRARGRIYPVLFREGTGVDSATELFADSLLIDGIPTAVRFVDAADVAASGDTVNGVTAR